MQFMQKSGCNGILLATTLALAACAGMQSQPPEEQVRSLADKRWQALLAQDYSTAYNSLTPSYRKIKSLEAYQTMQKSIPFKRISAKVMKVECAEEKCSARVALEGTPVGAFGYKGTVTSGVEETWVLEGGQWWFLEQL